MDFQQLLYFQTVARLEHFTRAAEELSLAEPSINRAVARLEKELGVPLFDRRGRGIRLNQFGRAFLGRVERAFAELEAGRQEVQDLRSAERGQVSITFPYSVGAHLLPPLLAAFRERYPLIRFRLFQNVTQAHMLRLLETGEVDLCLAMPLEGGPHIAHARILTEELLLAVPQDHRLASRNSVALREVAEDSFISMKVGYSTRTLTEALCRQAGFEPKITCEGEEFATVKALVHAGMGVALIPALAWQGMEGSKPIGLHVEEPTCQRTLELAWAKGRYLSAAAALFRQFIITQAGLSPSQRPDLSS